MGNLKRKLVVSLFLWGLLLALGQMGGIADNRFYQTGTFLLTVIGVFLGKHFVQKWKGKRKVKKERENT